MRRMLRCVLTPRARLSLASASWSLLCTGLAWPASALAQAEPQPTPAPPAEPAPAQPAPAEPAPAQPAPVELPPEPAPAELPPAEAAPAQPAPADTAAASAAAAAPAATPEATPQPSKPAFQIEGAPGKGLTVRAGDAFSLNLRSRFQLRYQLDGSAEDANEEREYQQLVNIGTARLWLSGNVYVPELRYMLQLAVAGRDYRDGATSPIFDAFIDYQLHRDLSVRAGQFFVPFDRLRTVRESGLQMADRPLPVGELTLDRDVGVVIYSEQFLGSPLAYRLGVFGGGGTNLSTGKEPGALLVGRLELRPLGPIDDDSEGDLARRAAPGLALGVGAAYDTNTNRQRTTTGATFSGGTTDYLHLAADLVFKWQGFAAQLEYLWKDASNDVITSLDDDGATLTERTRSGSGWIAQASYVFDPPIEVVGRLSRLYAFDGTDPRLVELHERAVGLNYYFNAHALKLQTDFIARVPVGGDFDQATFVVHTQLDATF